MNRAGTIFRQWRLEAKLRTIDVAHFLGVSHATVCFWESGRNIPDSGRADDIAAVFRRRREEVLSAISELRAQRLFAKGAA